MPRDVGLIAIVDIVNAIESRIAEEPQHLPECRRIIDKLITYLKVADHRFHFSVFISTIHSLHKLAQRLFHLSLIKG
jgi:hypothetical protein